MQYIDVRTETDHRLDRSVCHWAIQTLTGNWSFSQPVQRRIYYTNSQEGGTWSLRRQLIPTNFQSCSPVETLGTARRPSTDGLPDVRRPLAIVAVRLSPRSLDWNRHSTCTFWHPTGRRPWRLRCAAAFGSVGSIRHGRPRNTYPAPAVNVQHTRLSLTMVPVVSTRQNPACSPRLSQILSCSLGLRSTTRLCDRSDSFHFIHGGPGRTHWKSWVLATPLRRRHPDLRLLYTITRRQVSIRSHQLRRRRRWLDAVQPPATQR